MQNKILIGLKIWRSWKQIGSKTNRISRAVCSQTNKTSKGSSPLDGFIYFYLMCQSNGSLINRRSVLLQILLYYLVYTTTVSRVDTSSSFQISVFRNLFTLLGFTFNNFFSSRTPKVPYFFISQKKFIFYTFLV